MRGQKRVEDARERAYDPRIHLLRKNSLRKWMDCRVKPGNDGLKLAGTCFREDDGEQCDANQPDCVQLFCVSRNPTSTIAKPASCASVGTSPSTRKPIKSVNPGTSDGNTAARPTPSSTTEREKR
jgi:hypothetical protein